MKVYYISPSTIPSRVANSIHVVNMCEGLTQLGYEVVLFANSDEKNSTECHKNIYDTYGVDNSNISLILSRSIKGRAVELIISLNALIIYFYNFFINTKPNYIISRNIYSAAIFGLLLRKKIIYETHSPEHGLRGMLQKKLLNSKKVKTVVISDALKIILCSKYQICNESVSVFHDAARAGQLRLKNNERLDLRTNLFSKNIELKNFQKIIGYFGHLYEGRGIEIIEETAALLPEFAFLIYGGNEKEIKACKTRNSHSNLFFMGFINPKDIRQAMSMSDLLLMPYQRKVSIGILGSDTSQWMSPMKLFEYLSMGLPIISSDLPVLKEVLIDNNNCLLVDPEDVVAWKDAIKLICSDNELADKLGFNAHTLYKNKHTWRNRAKSMLELL